MAFCKNDCHRTPVPNVVAAALLVVAVLVRAAPAAAVTDVSVAVHLEALLEFKKGVVADPLGALSNWTVGASHAATGGFPPHCNWTGVA
jgi:LRR receptor-like serine/threonine-protein kinase FLS2